MCTSTGSCNRTEIKPGIYQEYHCCRALILAVIMTEHKKQTMQRTHSATYCQEE